VGDQRLRAAFGGFLLLGGRIADLLGRRRTFLGGLGLFAAASLLAGLAPSDGLLVAARAVQGLGAAALSPAALAILTVTFAPGRERNLAMGVWGALAGLGGTLGVIMGGVLVDALGWEWIFFVNLPMAAVVALATPVFVRESHSGMAERRFDAAGALLGTAGVLALVLGVIRTDAEGWGSAQVLGLFAAAAVLLAGFLTVEARATAPLVPLRLFRSRGLSVSGIALALNGSGFLAMFFLTALFRQTVRGASALEARLQFVPSALAGEQLVERPPGADGGRRLGDDVAAGARLPVAALDEQPLGALAGPAGALEREAAAELRPVQDEDRVTALERLGPRDAAALLVGPRVPHDPAATTVAALRPGVGQVVVVDLDGEPLGRGIHRRALRDGPGAQHAADLQTQVEVVARGPVLLDDEGPRAHPAGGELLVALDLRAGLVRSVGARRGPQVVEQRRDGVRGALGVDADPAVVVGPGPAAQAEPPCLRDRGVPHRGAVEAAAHRHPDRRVAAQ